MLCDDELLATPTQAKATPSSNKQPAPIVMRCRFTARVHRYLPGQLGRRHFGESSVMPYGKNGIVTSTPRHKSGSRLVGRVTFAAQCLVRARRASSMAAMESEFPRGRAKILPALSTMTICSTPPRAPMACR